MICFESNQLKWLTHKLTWLCRELSIRILLKNYSVVFIKTNLIWKLYILVYLKRMSFSLGNDTNLHLQFSPDPSYKRKELNCTGLSSYDKDRFLVFFHQHNFILSCQNMVKLLSYLV